MNMPIYYVIYFEEVIPCYLIKKGYIPCYDYREKKNDKYYAYANREDFCIKAVDSKKDIFSNKNLANQVCKDRIEQSFNKGIRDLIEDRNYKLKHNIVE